MPVPRGGVSVARELGAGEPPPEPPRLRLGLHGFGRIGRAVFRGCFAPGSQVAPVVVNEALPDDPALWYLLMHDSVHGAFRADGERLEDAWVVRDRKVGRTSADDMRRVPWVDHGAEVVIDATGLSSPAEWTALLRSGVRAVILTRHDSRAGVAMVAGASGATRRISRPLVVAAGTCDSNALVLLLGAIDPFDPLSGSVVTVHPWLNDMHLLDGAAPSGTAEWAVGRAAPFSIIPKSTSVLQAAAAVRPTVEQHFSAMSFRVPTACVSALHLCVQLGARPNVQQVHDTVANSRQHRSGRLACLTAADPLVSVDLVGTTAGVALDERWTSISEDGQLRLVGWYDNEIGYAHQILEIANAVGGAA